MKKRFLALISMAVLLATLAACGGSSMSLTYSVDTGDKIKVSLDTSNGHSLNKASDAFTIEKDAQVVHGLFINQSHYDAYLAAATALPESNIIEENDQYLLYEYDGSSGIETNIIF